MDPYTWAVDYISCQSILVWYKFLQSLLARSLSLSLTIPFLALETTDTSTLRLGPANLHRDPHYRHHLQKQKPFDNRRHSVKTDGWEWDLLNHCNFPRKSVTGVHVSSSSSAASNESVARVAAVPAGFPRSSSGAHRYRRRRWRHSRSNGLPHQHTLLYGLWRGNRIAIAVRYQALRASRRQGLAQERRFTAGKYFSFPFIFEFLVIIQNVCNANLNFESVSQ